MALTGDILDSKRVSRLFGARTDAKLNVHSPPPHDVDVLVSTSTGNPSLCPEDLSRNTPIFASTSTTPAPSGLVIIM